MPHVIVKMYAGRSDEQKQRMAGDIAKAVMTALGSQESSISVAVEEFDPAVWAEAVYKPDILEKPAALYKKPGYNPFA